MGCDFDLIIQALHDAKWVSIIKLYIKTPCYGYPLADAMWMLLKKEGIRGTYGMEFPVAERGDYMVLWGKKKDDVDEVDDEESGPEQGHEQGQEVDDEKGFVYYSGEQLKKLIGYCGPSIDMFDNTQSKKHIEALTPIPDWLPLALSSLPIREVCYDWSYPEVVHVVPELLTKTRTIRKRKLMRVLMIALKHTWLDAPMFSIIADYALPRASGVRLAWRDEEGNSESMRAGAEPPETTGTPPANQCVIQ
jgi:hypothetical protein